MTDPLMQPLAGLVAHELSDERLSASPIHGPSERKRIEDALTAVNTELEGLIYSVSHDLRAPIRQIDGFSKILAEHLGAALDDAGVHYLRRIQEGTQQLGRQVDDLLTLARLGRQQVQWQRVAIEPLVRRAIADLQAGLGERTIDWVVGGLPTLECDPALVQMVFANLLANAVKYTRGRARGVIETGQLPGEGVPTLFVRDNGVGFDMKYADRLFGVFQRLHRAEDFEGTGVGLATVQRIVHKHQGRVWADSRPDQGAAFFFTLGAME